MLPSTNWLVSYWKFVKQSINLNRWTVGASINKLVKNKGPATHVPRRSHGRSDIWSEYSTRMYILPGIKSICFQSLCVSSVSSHFVRLFPCLWNHRPQRYTCTGMGGVFATARVIYSSTYSPPRCCLFHCFVYIMSFIVFTMTRAVLLPDDCSRDYTTYIFLHWLSMATSNKHTRYFMWMEPLMP